MITIGSREYFKGINKIVYEGSDSKNPFAFKYYNPEQMVACLLYTSPSPRD